jgi:hypothetical protein
MQLRRLLLGMLLAWPVQAQSVVRTVSGVVFDSVARAPLTGAVVQVVLVDTSGGTARSESPRTFSGTADSNGRYRIPGLPAGRFVIGFQHDALNALGLESPLRAFELATDTSVTVDLAIPAGPAVRAKLCGDSVRLAGEGVLAGYILDARREGMVKGAVVRARWLEFALERNNFRAVHHTVTSVVGEDGRYLACGVTSDEAVAMEVTMPGYRGILQHVSVPTGGAVRQDYRLADSGVVRGTASITGRVVLADGSNLATGHVEIAALGLEVPVVNGEFYLAELPAGTWVVEAKALGFEPQSMLVDVTDRVITSAKLTLSERAQVLDALSVVGRRGGEAKILSAIASRRTTSIGTVFLPGNTWLESAYDPADVVRGATGFRYVNAEVLLSSGCGFKYPPSEEPVRVSGGARARTKTLAVYLNGLRVGGGLPELKTAVTMRDILAVEAYQEISSAPLEWRTNDACSVLAIWTRR